MTPRKAKRVQKQKADRATPPKKQGPSAARATEIHDRAVQLLAGPLGDAEMAELARLRAESASYASASASVSSTSGYVPYPALDDPDFARKLASKREFGEHATSASASHAHDDQQRKQKREKQTPEARWAERCGAASKEGDGAFELTRAQIVARNFLSPGSPYNGVLLMHGVGVGKTCTAVTIAEQFADRGMKVLVLLRPGLKENFKKTIFDLGRVARRPDGSLDWDSATQCTGTAYSDRVVDRYAITPEQVDARVARMVRSRYTFMGLNEFANVVAAATTSMVRASADAEEDADADADADAGDEKRRSSSKNSSSSSSRGVANERLRARFSDTVIVIDEAHNLRGGEDNKVVTPALRRVLSVTSNVKLVLLTATPMFNRASDLVDLVNLLLVNDKRRPLRPSEVFDKDGELVGERRLREALRGYVSFVPGGDPYSFPAELGPAEARDAAVLRTAPTIDVRGDAIARDDRLRVSEGLQLVASPLGAQQRRAYERIESRSYADAEADAEAEADSEVADPEADAAEETPGRSGAAAAAAAAMHAAMQTCNVVYPSPDGGVPETPTDRAAFERAFRRVGESRPIQVQYRAKVPPFLSPKMIDAFAPKIAAVTRRVARCEGVAMVYSRFLWGGLVPLALALEHLGFARFDAAPMLAGGGGVPPPGPPQGHPQGRPQGGRGGGPGTTPVGVRGGGPKGPGTNLGTGPVGVRGGGPVGGSPPHCMPSSAATATSSRTTRARWPRCARRRTATAA